MSNETIAPFGEAAYFIDLHVDTAPDRAARTHAAAERIRAVFPSADVVVGGGTVLVTGVTRSTEIEAALAEAAAGEAEPIFGRTHVIGVVYDGPDLEMAAAKLGRGVEEIVKRHVEREVTVELVGFLPGFGYLGPIDPRLALPRLASPRPRVAAGSVGIAGSFTGIYPFDSPGGWNLLGRAVSAALFDPTRDPPLRFAPGDIVRFEAIAPGEAPPEKPAPSAQEKPPPPARGLLVESASPGATVQAAGRILQLSRGLPPSGPLDFETHRAANEAVGNEPGAATIEIPLGSFSFRPNADVFISVNGQDMVKIAAGEFLEIPANEDRAINYLAVRGGIDVPLVLGSRSTLLVARLGGLSGRLLRRGDIVPVGDPEAAGSPSTGRYVPSEKPEDIVTILVDEGPHASRFPKDAFSRLIGEKYTASRLGDRVGLRLDGPKIPRDRPDLALPTPMLRGAVQVSTDGTPIVFGPDHPTTGGYPVLAVVRQTSLPALARRRPGQPLRFVRA